MTKKTLEEALSKPLSKEQEQTEEAFKVLCSKILSVRTEYKNLSFLIDKALKLALKDYIEFNNKNSLKVLMTLKQDKKSVYNLPYVKDFMEDLGLFLKYNPMEEALTVKEFKDFNREEALNSSYIEFKQAKQAELNAIRKEQALKEHKEKEKALRKFLNEHNFNGSLEEALTLFKM